MGERQGFMEGIRKTASELKEYLRNERADLFLTLDENMERGGLDAAGREAVAELLPDEAGEIIADESVEHAARFLGLAEILVERPRMGDGLFHGRRRDLIEQHPCGFFQSAGNGQMPSDRFALAVGVGGEEDDRAFLGEFFDGFDDGFFAGRDDIVRRRSRP